jgi:hypothetical protein
MIVLGLVKSMQPHFQGVLKRGAELMVVNELSDFEIPRKNIILDVSTIYRQICHLSFNFP